VRRSDVGFHDHYHQRGAGLDRKRQQFSMHLAQGRAGHARRVGTAS
jgi:hypothetical protein